MRSRRRRSSSSARAGSAASAGPTKCARRRASTAPSREPGVTMPIGEWLERGFVPAYGRKLSREELAEPRLAAAAGRHLRSGVPDAEELLRHQGLQFLRSLRAVRRPSQRPHRRARGRSKRPGARIAQLRTAQVEAMQRALTELGLYQRQDRRQGRDADALGARRLSEGERPQGRLLADRRGARPYTGPGGSNDKARRRFRIRRAATGSR